MKFTGQVLPSVKKIVYGVDFKRVMRSKLVLGIADGWLSADGTRDLQGQRPEGRPVPAGRGAAADRRLIGPGACDGANPQALTISNLADCGLGWPNLCPITAEIGM